MYATSLPSRRVSHAGRYGPDFEPCKLTSLAARLVQAGFNQVVSSHTTLARREAENGLSIVVILRARPWRS